MEPTIAEDAADEVSESTQLVEEPEDDQRERPTSVHNTSEPDVKNEDEGKLAGRNTPTLTYSAWRQWSAVIVTLSGFLAGVALAVGHHLHYRALHGDKVGSPDRQQWALRLGNFFAVATATCLRIAISSAYIQYVWRRIKHKAVSLETVDNAFEALSSVLAFAHLPLLRTMYTGVAALVVFWLIPIATLFPPATLSAVQLPVAGTVQALVPSILDDAGANDLSTYLAPFAIGEDGPQNLLGNLFDKISRSGVLLQPLAVASAADYSYPLTIHVPRYECTRPRPRSDAPEWDIPAVTALARDMMGSFFNDTILDSLKTNSSFGLTCGICEDDHWLRDTQIYFIAAADAMPEHYSALHSPEPLLPNKTVGFANNTLGYDPGTRGNISFAYFDVLGGDVLITDCQLYNTSLQLNVSVSGRDSVIDIVSKENVGIIDLSVWFPEAEGVNPAWSSYSAYRATRAWITLMYSLILGADPIASPRMRWGTGLADTVFNRTREYAQSADLSVNPGKLESWDRTARPALGQVIEELSLNFSLSLMSDEAFSRRVNVPTNFSGTDLRYLYEPANLLWSYGSIIIGTAVVVGLGMWAFVQNGTSHDNLISSFGAVLQNPELEDLSARHPVGTAAVDESVLKRKVILAKYDTDDTTRESSGHGLVQRRYWFVPAN